MWGTVSDRAGALALAIEFTGDAKLYGSYMLGVIEQWPYSCENALTDYSLNRKAWTGHAAVALAHQIPEDITRLAWGRLTHEQQVLANQEAGRAIQAWEYTHLKDRGLFEDVGGALLPEWNP